MGTEVATVKENGIIPFGDTPDYLPNVGTGLETLGAKDYKIPRLILLQALNPECRAFPGVAIPGSFWHTGANVSLGQKFNMIAALVSKKVILFKPRWDGGGLLAFSNDAVKWDSGANKSFTVHPVDKNPDTVVWNTGRDVASGGLTKWGSSNPAVENSQPAATAIYEYLVYLPDHPSISPVLFSMSKTALNSAKALNTTYMMLKKPMAGVVVEISAKEVTENNNTWYIPSGRGAGWAPKATYEMVEQMGKQYNNYKADYEDIASDYTPATQKPADASKDEIPF